MSSYLLPLILALSLFASDVMAEDATARLREKLSVELPGRKPDAVNSTPFPGLYEVVYGPEVLYFSADGRFLIKGELVDLAERVNLTERTRVQVRQQLVASIDAADAIVFGPDDAKYHVSVFTDVDCGYCRKLHQQIDDYIAQGIQVSYLLWPRGGEQGRTYDKSVDIWCSENQQDAYTRATQGKSVKTAEKDCQHPLDKLQILGQMVGVNGTPAILLDDGSLVPGYRPPKALIEMLEQRGG